MSNILLFIVSKEDNPVMCNEAPLSTMYILSLECIANPHIYRGVTSEEVRSVDFIAVSLILKRSLWCLRFFLILIPLCTGRAALVMISRTEFSRFTSQVNNYLQVG